MHGSGSEPMSEGEDLFATTRYSAMAQQTSKVTLRDMYQHLEQTEDRMIPDFMLKKDKGETMAWLKKMRMMMDSINKKELDSPEVAQLFEKQPGRVERVARGSGTKVEEVKELLCQFTMFVQWKQQKGIPANQNPHQPMQLRERN